MIDSAVHISKQSYTLNTSDVKVEENISFASLIHLSKTAIFDYSCNSSESPVPLKSLFAG